MSEENIQGEPEQQAPAVVAKPTRIKLNRRFEDMECVILNEQGMEVEVRVRVKELTGPNRTVFINESSKGSVLNQKTGEITTKNVWAGRDDFLLSNCLFSFVKNAAGDLVEGPAIQAKDWRTWGAAATGIFLDKILELSGLSQEKSDGTSTAKEAAKNV